MNDATPDAWEPMWEGETTANRFLDHWEWRSEHLATANAASELNDVAQPLAAAMRKDQLILWCLLDLAEKHRDELNGMLKVAYTALTFAGSRPPNDPPPGFDPRQK
jgi:hypothetical protein